MPTIIRHVKGRKNFTLILDEKVIKTFDNAVDQALSKKDELLDPLKKCSCDPLTNIEKEILNEIDLNRPKFEALQACPTLRELQKTLTVMNHLLRIFSRGQHHQSPERDKNGDFKLDPLFEGGRDSWRSKAKTPRWEDYNPMEDLFNVENTKKPPVIQGPPLWPVVEMEFMALKDANVVGTFEIIDAPGRDEIRTLPVIKPAVELVVNNSAAVICVLDINSAMSNAAGTCKDILEGPKDSGLPVFLLANRIGGLKSRVPKNLHRNERELGQKYIRETYNPPAYKPGQKDDERQVHGICALEALNVYTFRRKFNLDREKAMADVEGLAEYIEWQDGTVATKTGGKCFTKEELENCLWLMDKMKIKVEHLEDDEDDDEDDKAEHVKKWEGEYKSAFEEKELHKQLQKIVKKSGFEHFSDVIMKDLAPKSGQKVLCDNIKKAKLDLSAMILDMDGDICAFLQDNADFERDSKELEKTLEDMKKILKEDIEECRGKHAGELKVTRLNFLLFAILV
jgi:hypothetical protein